MRLPDAIAPYATLLKVALLVALIVGARVEGCMSANSKHKADAATKDVRIESLEASLTGFIELYDRANAQTEANAKAAKTIQDAGAKLVEVASQERAAAAKKAATLEQALQAERAGCVDGERQICGVPIR